MSHSTEKKAYLAVGLLFFFGLVFLGVALKSSSPSSVEIQSHTVQAQSPTPETASATAPAATATEVSQPQPSTEATPNPNESTADTVAPTSATPSSSESKAQTSNTPAVSEGYMVKLANNVELDLLQIAQKYPAFLELNHLKASSLLDDLQSNRLDINNLVVPAGVELDTIYDLDCARQHMKHLMVDSNTPPRFHYKMQDQLTLAQFADRYTDEVCASRTILLSDK